MAEEAPRDGGIAAGFEDVARGYVIKWLGLFETKDRAELIREYQARGAAERRGESEERSIAVDLDRSVHWIAGQETTLVDVPGKDRLKTEAAEILRSVSAFDHLKYIQGYDRYALISLALCYVGGMEQEAIVPVSYYLARGFLLVTRAERLTAARSAFWLALERELEAECPAFAAQLKEGRWSVELFALRWVLCLFCDEHSVRSVLQIWDLVAETQNRDEMLLQLCLAHAKQVPTEGGGRILETVHHFRKWDLGLLLQTARAGYAAKQRSRKLRMVVAGGAVVAVLAAVMVWRLV